MADERQRAAAALADGRWDEARAGFAAAIAAGPAEAPAGAAFAGLADALWWLGDSRGSVAQRERAYAAYCKSADTEGAIDAAARLSVDHKACFGNDVVAGGWLARAERLLDDALGDLGPLPGVVWLSRAFHTDDPGHAVELSERALALARDIGDMGLELVALGNLGRWLVEAGR